MLKRLNSDVRCGMGWDVRGRGERKGEKTVKRMSMSTGKGIVEAGKESHL